MARVSEDRDRLGTARLEAHHRPVLRALLLENLHPQARTIMEAAGYEVVTRSGALDES